MSYANKSILAGLELFLTNTSQWHGNDGDFVPAVSTTLLHGKIQSCPKPGLNRNRFVIEWQDIPLQMQPTDITTIILVTKCNKASVK